MADGWKTEDVDPIDATIKMALGQHVGTILQCEVIPLPPLPENGDKLVILKITSSPRYPDLEPNVIQMFALPSRMAYQLGEMLQNTYHGN